MQSAQELESWYSEPDRWGYFSNPEDSKRLNYLIDTIKIGKNQYERALDVGCGEGFITRHLPANEIHGLDISNNALNRLPENVIPIQKPIGKYDLVISSGTLYSQYDHESMAKLIKEYSSQYILIAGILEWLVPYSFGKIISEVSFQYREFTQKATLYVLETSA